MVFVCFKSRASIIRSMMLLHNASSASAKKGVEKDIIDLTTKLINGIAKRDYGLYTELCDGSLTCFEPEAFGNLVQGLNFHKFYFDNLKDKQSAVNTSLINPVVHVLGDNSACIAYVRLIQSIDKSGQPLTTQSEETRVWHKKEGGWKCVHFHRSQNK